MIRMRTPGTHFCRQYQQMQQYAQRMKGERDAQPPHSHYIDPGRVLPGLPRRAAGGKPRRAAGGKAPQGENFRDCGRSTKAKWP